MFGQARWGWRVVLGLVLVGGIVAGLRPSNLVAAEKLTPEQVAALIPQLFKLHLQQREMDTAFTKRMLKEYVNQLDPANRFFTKEEADQIVNLPEEDLKRIAQQAQNADFSHFQAILKGFLDKQIARDAELYASLEKRIEEIKELAKTKPRPKLVDASKDPKGAAELNNPNATPLEKIKTTDARPDETAAADDEEDEDEKIKWTERAANQAERENRLLRSMAQFYNWNISYLSESEGFKLALQTIGEERNKWLKVSMEEETPKLFLKAFMAAMDPHTVYFDADEDEFGERLQPNFAGIGVQIRPCPLGAQVEDIIKGGPTEKSGKLARGDQIVAVDGFVLAGLPINKIVKRIKGERGTPVRLTVLKRETKETEIITLVRDIIELSEMRVKGKKYDTPAGPIGFISVQNFYRDVHKHVRERITELGAEKPLVGLVLDLRANQGGYLDEAVNLAGLFIESGPIVGERDGHRTEWKYDYDGTAIRLPLVILTSQFSASASEIVAGTLRDYNRAIVVAHTQTFGKGTVQRVIPLSTLNLPGEIKITTHQYFLAGGNSVQLKGVDPDILIPGPKLQEDLLEKAAENAIPFNRIDGRINPKNPDVRRWQEWKTAQLADLQARSKARVEASAEFKDAFDVKKQRQKRKDEEAKLAAERAKNPDAPPPLTDPKKEEKDVQADEAVAIVQDMVNTWPSDKQAAK